MVKRQCMGVFRLSMINKTMKLMQISGTSLQFKIILNVRDRLLRQFLIFLQCSHSYVRQTAKNSYDMKTPEIMLENWNNTHFNESSEKV